MKFGAVSYLDGKKLFEVYWVDMGAARSIQRLQQWCGANGFVHPQTNKPPSRMGIWKSMYRWAGNNMEEALKIANKGVSQHGEYITQEEWMATMKNKVHASWQNDNAENKWKKEHAS